MDLLRMDTRRLPTWPRRSVTYRRIAALAAQNALSRRSVLQVGGPVVSLTSHGTRLDDVHLGIESIAAGSMRPGRLILWVDDTAWLQRRPGAIRRLERRGLEVRWTEDHGPHKKYLPYAMSIAEHHEPLVTADDDYLFPHRWLETLMAKHQEDPSTDTAHRIRYVTIDDDGPRPYREWPLAAEPVPSPRNVAGGGWGHVIVPEVLDALRSAGTAFRATAPRADDLWLHYMAVRHGCPVKPTGTYDVADFLEVPTRAGANALWMENNTDGGNDSQIAALWDDDFRRTVTGSAGRQD